MIKTLLKIVLFVLFISWIGGMYLQYQSKKVVQPTIVIKNEPLDTNKKTITPSVSKPKNKWIVYKKGKRGGCYYVNDKGKKVYVDEIMCR